MTPLHAVIGMTELALHQPLNPVTQALLSRSLDAAHTLRGALQALPLATLSRPEAAVPEPVASRKLMQRAVAALPSAPEPSQRWLQVDPAWPVGLMVIDQLWRELMAALFASVELPITPRGETAAGTVAILHLCAPPFSGWTRVTIRLRSDVPSDFTQSSVPPQRLDTAVRRLGGRVQPLAPGNDAFGWQVDLPLPAAPLDMLSEVGHAAIAPLATGLLPLSLALHHALPSGPGGESPSTDESLAPSHALSSARQDSQTAQQPLQGFRLLVVDDVENNLIVTGGLLEEAGAEVEVATNGQEALNRLRAQIAGEQAPVDLVLMDCQMPGLDGFQTTRQIRGDLGLTKLPILALTANSSHAERSSSLAAGMDDHLNKPLSSKSLVKALLRHLQPAGPARGVSVQTPIADIQPADSDPVGHTDDTHPEENGPESRWPAAIKKLAQAAGLDLLQIDRLFGNATPLFVRALGKCLEDEARHLRELSEIRAEADLPRLRAWLHARSGVWTSLGLSRLHQHATAVRLACEHRVSDGERELDELTQALADGHGPLTQLHEQLMVRHQGRDVEVNDRSRVEWPALAPSDLEQLLQLLEAWDMEALRVYEQHKDRLMNALDPAVQQRLDDCLTRLRFAEAASLLRAANLGIARDQPSHAER
jgi:CheY-like chemotaxis protein/HPt (histidine-containing phosphotransfer) domain-containing protein